MIYIIFIILIAAISIFYRVVKGPSIPDRIAAMDSIGVMFLIILVLLGFYYDREIFIDVAVVYGILLFVDILIMAKYFGKPSEGGSSDD